MGVLYCVVVSLEILRSQLPRVYCYTETEMSSFWWNFHHWLHWKLSKWQLPVQPMIKISSKWRHFRFSVCHHDDRYIANHIPCCERNNLYFQPESGLLAVVPTVDDIQIYVLGDPIVCSVSMLCVIGRHPLSQRICYNRQCGQQFDMCHYFN